MATAVAPVLRRWLGAAARSPFGKPAQPPPAKYGGRHTVAMIPGDGIGPELMAHVRDVFRCACVPIDFEVVDVRPSPDSGASLEGALTAIRRNRVALKGNIETNHNMPPSHKSSNNLLRTSLDLYANVIHCRSLPGVLTRHQGIDILIIRENTEGEYSNLEHEVGHPSTPLPRPQNMPQLTKCPSWSEEVARGGFSPPSPPPPSTSVCRQVRDAR
ncbi:isocitrate dehydrogenase [NAD] subunit gamma, mitochondrial-like isoform X2 [Hypanus sabinus]|uniref:isocitrate dehydrogenase [NAD] subunit gamma, mitochondrial-like isoform X2 n=1 Tax=Hypanus sabinus TaxID=79690 RepID=UPI0028C3BDCB|nr:isocitrate dehydrogenase [NAD] subunit gamma, mitochondrial-like isoform X2 [Hypanus sabinus]